MESHRVRGGFRGVRNRNDDRIFIDFEQLPLFKFQVSQFAAKFGTCQIDAAVIKSTGDIGEVNPLEEAVRLSGIVCELRDFNFAINNRDCMSGFERFDFAAIKPEIH